MTRQPTTHDPFRALIDALPDGVAVHRGGVILFINPAGLRLLGYDRPEELVGQPIVNIVHPEERGVVVERIRRMVLTGEQVPPAEERLVTRDGQTVHALVAALPVPWEDGPAFCAFAQDLTRIRSYEESLVAAERLASIGTLAAGIAHDLNNPLASMVLSLELALEELESDALCSRSEGVRSRIGTALAAARRIRSIMTELRLFARQPDPDEGPAHLPTALTAALDVVRNHLRHRVTLEVEQQPVPPVRGSEGWLVQILVNLLTNAVQAFPEDRLQADCRVWIRVEAVGADQVRVQVEDNGEGIAEEHLHHVLEPYFSTKAPGEGTGLGLWMVQGVLTRLGGTVDVQSRVGVGTTVTVLLPVAEEHELAAEEPHREEHGERRLRVLVVDDEPDLLDLVRTVLSDHDVETAGSGPEALERIQDADRPFELVLCDVMMPEMSGGQLYREVASLWPGLERRFAFATGGAFTGASQRLLDQSNAMVLHKPYGIRELRSLVSTWEVPPLEG